MSRRTPLYDQHQAVKARIVDFAGWEMPIQYHSITVEHQAVRESAGIFDVSHMGRFFISGNDAAAELEKITVARVADLDLGRVRYSPLCNADGGTKDDVMVACLERDSFLVVVN